MKDAINWQSISKLSYVPNLIKGDIFFFNNVVGHVLAAMLEGATLPSNMAAKTITCLCLVKRLIVTLIFDVNTTTASF